MNSAAQPAAPAWDDSRRASRGSRTARDRDGVETGKTPRYAIETPRWLLLACLVFAPWAYGSTRPWAVTTLSFGLIGAGAFWLIVCAVRRQWPVVPVPVIAAGCLLLFQGWWMTWNARAEFEPAWRVVLPIDAKVEGAPGTLDGALSRFEMLKTTGLILALMFACDLARCPRWRRRLIAVMVLTAISVAAFGLALKLGGVAAMAWFWPAEKINAANNFGLFRYRGNAGAFLNLALAPALALAWLSFRRRRAPWVKTGWVCGLFLILAAVQFNPSRASWIVAWLILGLSAAIAAAGAWRSGLRPRDWNLKIVAVYTACALLLALGLGTLLVKGNWETSWQRLALQGLDVELRRPVPIFREITADAGWTGFGPGTFGAIFPAYQASHDYANETERQRWGAGYWRYAHHDYYQTVIEWGYLGTAAWAALILGGLIAGTIRLSKGDWNRSNAVLLAAGMIAWAGLLTHSLVDFPWQVASIQAYALMLLALCWTHPVTGGRNTRSN